MEKERERKENGNNFYGTFVRRSVASLSLHITEKERRGKEARGRIINDGAATESNGEAETKSNGRERKKDGNNIVRRSRTQSPERLFASSENEKNESREEERDGERRLNVRLTFDTPPPPLPGTNSSWGDGQVDTGDARSHGHTTFQIGHQHNLQRSTRPIFSHAGDAKRE